MPALTYLMIEKLYSWPVWAGDRAYSFETIMPGGIPV